MNMKILSFTKKKILALVILVSVLLLSVSSAIVGLTTVHAASVDWATYTSEITALYDTYLESNSKDKTDNAVRSNNDNIKGFINANVGSDGKLNGVQLYVENGRSKDILSNEAIEALRSCFGLNTTTILQNGATIGNIKTEDHVTGDFKAYSSSFVEVGGASLGNNDFSIVVMGDQQTAVEYHSAYVAKSYDYIKANATAMNLKAFINVGDIVDDSQFLTWRQPTGDPRMAVNYNPNRLLSDKEQLQFAKNQADKLFDLNIPLAMTMGNHDYADMAESYRVKDGFNQYFLYNDYSSKSWFGESLYNDIEAATYYFEANGDEYMIITLGTYPTTEMVAWANQMVEANPDKKVIVSTHAYIAGDSNGDLRQDGQRLWDNFISKHENIFMVVCGHECTNDGSVIKRLDFGENGNPVYQFMINPQIEEFGGAGIFAQLIFRENGDVDFVYYSPKVDETDGKGYFMNENQFSFNLNVSYPDVFDLEYDEEQIGSILVNKSFNYSSEELWNTAITRDLDEDGVSYENYYAHMGNEISFIPTDNAKGYNKNVYATAGAKQNGNGFVVDTENDYTLAYVSTAMYVGDYKYVFTKLGLKVNGCFTSDKGFYAVEVSADGSEWTNALYNDAATGIFDKEFDISRFIAGIKYMYIRVVFSDALISKIYANYAYTKTIFNTSNDTINVSFENEMGSNVFSNYENLTLNGEEIFGAYSSYYAVYSGGILGSGGSGRLTYKSDITFRFDGGSNSRLIKQINPIVTMRVKDPTAMAMGHDFQEADTKNYLKFSMSFDNGKTWKQVSDNDDFKFTDLTYIDDVADNVVCKTTFVDGEGYLEGKGVVEELKDGASSVLFRIEYFGAGSTYADCGIKNVSLKVVYSSSLEERALADKNFDYNGGDGSNDALNPTREGYKFAGWYYNGVKCDPTSSEFDNGSFTFVAKWTRLTYNVTYILDGGKNNSINVGTMTAGEFLVLAPAKKVGKTFVGWFDENGNQVTRIEGNNLKDDLVLYAIYKDAPAEANEGGCGSSVNVGYIAIALIPAAFIVLVIRAKQRKN